MVHGATASATARLVIGELTYDHFLAECSQATAVQIAPMAAAIERLLVDPALARHMGQSGRRRASDQFEWSKIIERYEQLWREQDQERTERARLDIHSHAPSGPALYPAPERSFAGYPTRYLDETDRVSAVPDWAAMLEPLLAMPLTHHAASHRVASASLLEAALQRAPCSIAELDEFWKQSAIDLEVGRATLGWMLKYDLLRAVIETHAPGESDR
jgi:hypothetical protein